VTLSFYKGRVFDTSRNEKKKRRVGEI